MTLVESLLVQTAIAAAAFGLGYFGGDLLDLLFWPLERFL